MEELNFEKCLGELKLSEINKMKKPELVEWLVIAKLKGIYKEDEDRLISDMSRGELCEELKNLVCQCR